MYGRSHDTKATHSPDESKHDLHSTSRSCGDRQNPSSAISSTTTAPEQWSFKNTSRLNVNHEKHEFKNQFGTIVNP